MMLRGLGAGGKASQHHDRGEGRGIAAHVVHRLPRSSARLAPASDRAWVPAPRPWRPPLAPAASRAEAVRRGHTDASLQAARRRGSLLRPVRGAYVDPAYAAAPVGFYRHPDADAIMATARAAACLLPPGGAIADETAAFLLCGLWPPDSIPRAVLPAPITRARRMTVVIREASVPSDRVVRAHGLPVTDAHRTAIDLARTRPLDDALVAVDALLHSRLTTPAQLARELAIHAGQRGIRRARRVVELADGRSESPGETRLRLALVEAGIGPVRPQAPMLGGRFRVDLLVGDRVFVEYDGEHHNGEAQRRLDRPRARALARIPGSVLLCYGRADLSRLPEVVAEVRRTLIESR